MENKILQLLQEKGTVSLTSDILPLVLTEFEDMELNSNTCEMAACYVSQLLYSVYASGVNVVCLPKFSGIPHTGTLAVEDMVYTVVKESVKV
ncbi:MAG: hypothetical protein ENTB_01385 [Enterocloster aldenensis]